MARPTGRSRNAFVRNDIRQYDELQSQWWNERGPFAMLQWIADARARLIPPALTADAVLLDIACGGGLMAPYMSAKGYRHVGVDITASALMQAQTKGTLAVRADVTALPFANDSFEVVCAGEILEHVEDLRTTVAESARVLKPGGTIVLDTIADTMLARFLVVEVAERIPGGAPPGIHDPRLFVDREFLVSEYARHGIELTLSGLRPSIISILEWAVRIRTRGRMTPTPSTAVVFQAWGVKR